MKELSIEASKALRDLITSDDTNFYLALGRPGPWEDDIPTANTSYVTNIEVWQNLYGGKKIVGSDLSHVAKRFNWTANTVYAQFEHTQDYNQNTQFYVLTSANNVYKCISNNYGATSTTEPSSLTVDNITQTADGYKWKYMYSISLSDQERFLTDDYMPVKNVSLDDGSLQWDVQDSATPGAIYHIQILNGGTGYSNASNITITIRGDGQDAVATANINNVSNSINTITMVTYGTNYSYADITIEGDGTGANVKALIAPPEGHGSDPVAELNGVNLMINPRITGTESDKISIANEIRQLALITNPKVYGTANVLSNSAFSQALTISVSNYGADYYEDEIVYQGTSYLDATFAAQILEWDSANLRIKLINTRGTPTSDILTGSDSGASRVLTSIIKYPDCTFNTGRVIYVENIDPIQRDENQTESFKLIIRPTIS